MEIAPWERLDKTLKGPGFDAYYAPDTGWMTEYSQGDPRSGAFYPLFYQGITPWEMESLADAVRYGMNVSVSPERAIPAFPDEVYPIYDNAFSRASERVANGLSPFWTPADGPSGVQWELMRRPEFYR